MAIFQYAVVSSILHDEPQKMRLLGIFEDNLQRAGGELLSLGSTLIHPRNSALPLFMLVLTGGTESEAMRLISREKMLELRMPIVLFAHPSQNSLPASLEILAKVKQDGGKGLILQADASGAFDSKELEDIIAVCQSKIAMRNCRIGVVGRPSDWLIASSQDSLVALNSWGVELIDIPLEELMRNIGEIRSSSLGAPIIEDLQEKAEFFSESSNADLLKSMEILQALRTLVDRYKLSSLTLRCFDLVLKDQSTGCLALSQLADEGIDAGCEGDIPSIIGLSWIRSLTGQIGWMANPSHIIIKKEDDLAEMLVAHCTAPRSILSKYGLRSHFESGIGVAIAGILPKEKVTLFRIGGKHLEELWYSTARVIASPRGEGLCRTQALLSLSNEKAQEMLTNPLGNHLVMVRGNWTRRISVFEQL
ncbi:MAG: hypothetical protein BWX81_01383 [Spirochaetes bacterium ADurb.Bin110]|nr:MAG: hypothetical protein BWX81_01383 [Spirochaetes bacterium ADurb.Bin110]